MEGAYTRCRLNPAISSRGIGAVDCRLSTPQRAVDWFASLTFWGRCAGALYLLPMTIVRCHDQGTPSSGALYPDEGSALMTWRENVVSNIGASEWAHIWTSTIRDILFADNFHDTAKIDKEGVNITMSGNVLVSSHDFPAAATAIMAAAGPINASWLR